MSRAQIVRAWYITLKDIRTYYLKPPLISWGILLPPSLSLPCTFGPRATSAPLPLALSA